LSSLFFGAQAGLALLTGLVQSTLGFAGGSSMAAIADAEAANAVTVATARLPKAERKFIGSDLQDELKDG
jgi:hypothetical protein